jgi:hypothetical protein
MQQLIIVIISVINGEKVQSIYKRGRSLQMIVKGNKRGKESDKMLLQIIEKYPGLSQYELARKLEWPSGRIDGSIRRLLNANKIFIRVLERNGRRVNLVYPKDQKPSNIVEVPIGLLHAGNPIWSESAFVYALDNSTIGISGAEMPEWGEISCFLEKVPIRKGRETIILKIPEKIVRFYSMERKHRVVSINGNTVLVTISGDIIEEKKYPA